MRTKRKRKGEVFYRSHPIVQPIGRTQVQVVYRLGVGRVLWWALGLVEFVMLFRILISAFGANGGNLVTSAIYSLSYPLVWFFFYLFNTLDRIQVVSTRFEVETLASMAFYYIIVYIAAELISVFRSSE